MSIFQKISVSFLLLTCMKLHAAIVSYTQDFEGMQLATSDSQFGPSSELSIDGWEVSANVFDGAGNHLYFYGSFYPAPNDSNLGFSGVSTGDMTIDNGSQYLSVYSDYNNRSAHDQGNFVNALFIQSFVIDENDFGKTLTFSFDAKRPDRVDDEFGNDSSNAVGNNCSSTCSAQAFMQVIDPSNNYWTTLKLFENTTWISQDEWSSYSMTLELNNPLLIGQILHIGFESFVTNDDNSTVYYDNISIGISEVPLPAGIYLFLSGLVGLSAVRIRRKSS